MLEEKEPVGVDWLGVVEKKLEGVDGGNIEERIANKTVFTVEHYINHSKEENEARAKRILSGFKYFNILTPTKVPLPPHSSTTPR